MTFQRIAREGRVAALGATLVALSGCWGNASDKPPIHLQQNMDFQEYGEAQERNGFFADDRAMRKPPQGTVAVGFLKTDDHLYRGIDQDGNVADELPAGMVLDDALLARGEERYNIYCAPCHDAIGTGHGMVTRRGGGMTVQPANLLLPNFQSAPLGYLYRVITYGQGQMRPYASQVPVADRWAIAAWVRVLQISHRARRSDIPADALVQSSPTERRAQ